MVVVVVGDVNIEKIISKNLEFDSRNLSQNYNREG